jgi:hypothetical protein
MASINLASLAQVARQSQVVPAKGLAGQKYKKLLLVCKESKLTRFQKKGVLMTPYVEKHYKASM